MGKYDALMKYGATEEEENPIPDKYASLMKYGADEAEVEEDPPLQEEKGPNAISRLGKEYAESYSKPFKQPIEKTLFPFASSIKNDTLPIINKPVPYGKEIKKNLAVPVDMLGWVTRIPDYVVGGSFSRGANAIKDKIPGDGVVSQNLKTGVDIVTDPTTYFGAGAIKKLITKGPEQAIEQAAKQTMKPFGAGAIKQLNKVDDAIEMGISKGVKPSINGKKTLTRQDAFYNKANDAVKTITEMKDQLNIVDEAGERVVIPRNANEFAQAIDQTKKKIYQQYHEMAAQSGDAGAMFDATGAINDLKKVANPANKAKNPQIRQYAADMIDEIQELNGQPLTVVEERIADLNQSLKGYYDGRVSAGKAQVDASVASLLRKELDSKITNAVGEGYQKLKNKYGSLLAIEGEVNHRAIVNARRANSSVVDFTDIFTGGDIIGGVLTGNGFLVLKGVAGKAIKETIKKGNNPENYIRKMFSAVDNAQNTGVQLRGGINDVLRQHQTPKLTGNVITDEKRLFPLPMIGDNPQKISNMEIPIGAKIRNLGEEPVYRDIYPDQKKLPSPEDVKGLHPHLSKEDVRPMAQRFNDRKALSAPMVGDPDIPFKKEPMLPTPAERFRAIGKDNRQYPVPGTSTLTIVPDQELVDMLQKKGIIEEMQKLKEGVPVNMSKDQLDAIQDFVEYMTRNKGNEALRKTKYQEKKIFKKKY